MNKKIEIPIYYYWKVGIKYAATNSDSIGTTSPSNYIDVDGVKYYDYDSMGDEYADKLREITDENVEVIIKSNDKQTWEVR